MTYSYTSFAWKHPVRTTTTTTTKTTTTTATATTAVAAAAAAAEVVASDVPPRYLFRSGVR